MDLGINRGNSIAGFADRSEIDIDRIKSSAMIECPICKKGSRATVSGAILKSISRGSRFNENFSLAVLEKFEAQVKGCSPFILGCNPVCEVVFCI